ncbi:unnamed protein product [Nezara viridula]|uniref:Uncharacterized protein n=1 Tax=Nezara viridula TaxID=85310 RepID=A0A9P0HT17_NEZVI|nr:unnamed protein product [Nezara viridula]
MEGRAAARPALSRPVHRETCPRRDGRPDHPDRELRGGDRLHEEEEVRVPRESESPLQPRRSPRWRRRADGEVVLSPGPEEAVQRQRGSGARTRQSRALPRADTQVFVLESQDRFHQRGF